MHKSHITIIYLNKVMISINVFKRLFLPGLI